MAYLRMLLTVLLSLSVTRSVLGLTFGFPYGKEKVRGVNLGGWLVLEVGTRENRVFFWFSEYGGSTSSSLGSRRLSLMALRTTALLTNIPLVNTWTRQKVAKFYSATGIRGSPRKILKTFMLLGMLDYSA